MNQPQEISSRRPYTIRSVYEWCVDNGLTPYIAVHVDERVQVPMEYVSNGEIVLNVGPISTSSLEMGNDYIRFQTRFAGVLKQIIIPVDHVLAIFARENGQGEAFPAPISQENALEDLQEGIMSEDVDNKLELNTSKAKDGSGLHLVGAKKNQKDNIAKDTPPDDEPSPPTPNSEKKPTLKIVK